MRNDKDKAFKLRKEGKSYRFIEEELGVSRSTLSNWFRDISWSKHLTIAHRKQTWSPENIRKMQHIRSIKLQSQYEAAETEAIEEYKTFKQEPLFWAGLMAYAGEGDKRNKGLIRITNAEFHIHKIFVAFLERYLGVSRTSIRCGLILSPDLNESLCREMWSNLLGIPREQFYKSQILLGKVLKRRLQYGVGMSIITNTVLKKKLLKWLALAQDEKFDAIIV